ncbi:MAG: PAS domain-containing sensor histidine kinase [Candidatus Thorarchaeota archaeon]|nr:PAS domain-containing sensor histidine kinase [Candidatus Thorarchaeota archaeon]
MSDVKQATEWLRQIMDVVHDGMLVIQDDDIIIANGILANMLGYDEETLMDMDFKDLVDSLSRRHNQAAIEALVTGENPTKFSTRLKSKDGDVLHVEISPTVITMGDGPAVLAAVRDISRQIELEETVIQLEQRFASLYDLSPVPYMTLDSEGAINQVNQATEELLGCSADGIIGRPLGDFLAKQVKEDEYDPSAAIINEVMRGKSVQGIELELADCEDRSVWVSVSSRSLNPEAERPTEIGLTAVQITRRKHAEETLRQESERANLYFELMTSDLNIILQSVLFAIEDLKLSLQMSEREMALVNDSSWNLRRAARLIVNMGVLLSLGRTSPESNEVNLRAHIRRAAIEVERDFEGKNLQFESNMPEEGYDVKGHAFLHNVFFNILHNAMTYDDKDPVEISVNAELQDFDREVKVEFEDHGTGIPDEQKQLIFRRTPDADSSVIGKGLGLTVADRYISHLGGRIWVEDRVKGDPSQGSKFVVVLPLWKETFELPTITFYKSDHCVFCGPVFDTLSAILDEMGIGRTVVSVINIDDPDSGVTEDDLPALPTIEMGGQQLTGFLSEDDLRVGVMQLLMTAAR